MTREELLAEIRKHPEKHRHDFEGLMRCSMVKGALDIEVMDVHSGITGSNGGTKCDVTDGPCACGAWHRR